MVDMNLTALVEAAEQAPTAIDYTPAFIGFGGVIMGGIIQTVAQIYKERSIRVNETRTKVMDFAQLAMLSLNALSHLALKRKTAEWNAMSRGDRKATSQSVTKDFPAIYAQGFALLAVTDARVAMHSEKVMNDITTFVDSHERVMKGDPLATDDEFPDYEPVQERINELITMVSPRWYEKHARFRSVKWAKRKLERDEKREERNKRKNG